MLNWLNFSTWHASFSLRPNGVKPMVSVSGLEQIPHHLKLLYVVKNPVDGRLATDRYNH